MEKSIKNHRTNAPGSHKVLSLNNLNFSYLQNQLNGLSENFAYGLMSPPQPFIGKTRILVLNCFYVI